MMPAQQPPFSVVEATIAEMQAAMRQGRITSRGIVQQYLDRIAKYEERLNAIITLNPRALDEADARDRERAQGKVRGPLHGIPIALKDNIHTTDMPTTGGALAFKGFVPPYEATLTKNLRDAGAIIIAKTNMTELANWIATGMPGNYNALAGYGFNPYDPRPDPREGTNDGRPALNAGGSSSGAGTAANFWAANVGTETSGSILTPANQTMLVGIKPTVGRISRYGIIPITADQDTAGPMARTVADAAILLGVLEGARAGSSRSRDEGVPASARTATTRASSTREGSQARASACRARRSSTRSATARLLREAIAVLQQHGATVVDPADIPRQPPPVCRDEGGMQGQGRELFDRVQVRHEARLQRVARVARTGLAGQDADRAARMEPCAPRRRCNQIWPGAARQFRRGRSRARSRALSCRSRDRRTDDRRRRHRCGDEARAARCAAVSADRRARRWPRSRGIRP